MKAVSNIGGRASKYIVLRKEAGSWEKGQALGLGPEGEGILESDEVRQDPEPGKRGRQMGIT